MRYPAAPNRSASGPHIIAPAKVPLQSSAVILRMRFNGIFILIRDIRTRWSGRGENSHIPCREFQYPRIMILVFGAISNFLRHSQSRNTIWTGKTACLKEIRVFQKWNKYSIFFINPFMLKKNNVLFSLLNPRWAYPSDLRDPRSGVT